MYTFLLGTKLLLKVLSFFFNFTPPKEVSKRDRLCMKITKEENLEMWCFVNKNHIAFAWNNFWSCNSPNLVLLKTPGTQESVF